MPGFDDFMQQLYNRPLFFMKLIVNKVISILRWFLHIEASPQNSRLSKYPKKYLKKKKNYVTKIWKKHFPKQIFQFSIKMCSK